MGRQTDKLTVYRVATLYYAQKMTQEQIAAKENISRSQVSRLLDKAVEFGIVSITINMPSDLDQAELAKVLARKLGLSEVLIADAPADLCRNGEMARQFVAEKAAQQLPRLLSSCKNIGIGWGRTLYETSLLLPKVSGQARQTFIPLLGASGDDVQCLQINNIVDRFSERLSGHGIFTNILTIRGKAEQLSPIEQSRVDNLRSLWTDLDAAVYGIGTMPDNHNAIFSEFSGDYVETIQKSGTIGDILAQYFYPDGTCFSYDDRYVITSYPIERMRHLKKGICIAGGEEKVPVLLAAAQNRFYTTLITDAHTARLMFTKL